MTEPVADDFEFIRRRMHEIEEDDDPTLDPAEEEECPGCEGSGWEMYGIGVGDPHFRECTICGNPHGFECP